MNRSQMAKTPTSNIEKALSGGGINEIPLDMKQFIKMADKEKIEFSIENDLFETLEKQWLEEREPGEALIVGLIEHPLKHSVKNRA